MLEEIIMELGDNFNSNDKDVLKNILDNVTANALTISNRAETIKDKTFLSQEIKTCVIGMYLQRGSEGLNSLSQSGVSSTFNDCMDKLRNDIIKNGKRQCY